MSNISRKIAAGLLIAAGAGLLLYPGIAQGLNALHQSKAEAAYDQWCGSLNDDERQTLWDEASAYNQQLSVSQTGFELTEAQAAKIHAYLDGNGTDVIGTLTIDKIDLSLPIYHGLSDDVLANGAGHMDGSSLPVGGAGSHCVLAGHRGLPEAQLFTRLDELESGDIIELSVLSETLYYQVTSVEVVNPDEMDSLYIEPGKDLLTLVTCTPLGVNNKRLLVHAQRVQAPDTTVEQTSPCWAGVAAAAAGLIVILAVYLACKYKKGQHHE